MLTKRPDRPRRLVLSARLSARFVSTFSIDPNGPHFSNCPQNSSVKTMTVCSLDVRVSATSMMSVHSLLVCSTVHDPLASRLTNDDSTHSSHSTACTIYSSFVFFHSTRLTTLSTAVVSGDDGMIHSLFAK